MVPCEKLKTVFFLLHQELKIVLFSARSRFVAKLTRCIFLDQHQVLAVYLNLSLLSYSNM